MPWALTQFNLPVVFYPTSTESFFVSLSFPSFVHPQQYVVTMNGRLVFKYLVDARLTRN